MKYLVMVCISIATLVSITNARENPFVPISSEENVGKATQIKDTRKSFNYVTTTLPSSARILKRIELYYQNLDGSIENKSVAIDEKIDWHDELILQKLTNQKLPEDLPVATKAAAKLPKPIVSKTKKSELTKRSFKGVLDFQIQDDKIQIFTKDTKIRDFLITDPYKIVIDFERELDFYTKSYEIKKQKVVDVTFGKHAGYYRMVIALDGQYRYNLQKSSKGFNIELY